MTQSIRLWEVRSDQLVAIDSRHLDLESRLETWLERDTSLLGEDFLVIGRQVITSHGGIVDLLCLDRNGDVVLVELKRAKTPREVTAQVLDYASWASALTDEQLQAIAASHSGVDGTLEDAFQGRFGEELPEVVNESQRMIVVATEIDPSSERIIRYLSDTYGVSINGVTFQFFQVAGVEVLGRVFLIEPEEVEYRSTSKGRGRRKKLTYSQLEQIADERGVGDIYRAALEALEPLFGKHRTTRSGIGFKNEWRDGRGVMLNLLPGESGIESGLRFQAYSLRLAESYGMSEQEVRALLPSTAESWAYSNKGPEWAGYTGYFNSVGDVKRLAAGIRAGTRRSGV
jgi:hypothetical protein